MERIIIAEKAYKSVDKLLALQTYFEYNDQEFDYCSDFANSLMLTKQVNYKYVRTIDQYKIKQKHFVKIEDKIYEIENGEYKEEHFDEEYFEFVPFDEWQEYFNDIMHDLNNQFPMVTIEKIIINSYSIYIYMSDKSKNISASITSHSQCCEEFGVEITSNSSKFLNSEYISVCVNNDNIDFSKSSSVDVNIETSVGTLTITLYNMHNGYYPHGVSITAENIDLNFQL